MLDKVQNCCDGFIKKLAPKTRASLLTLTSLRTGVFLLATLHVILGFTMTTVSSELLGIVIALARFSAGLVGLIGAHLKNKDLLSGVMYTVAVLLLLEIITIAVPIMILIETRTLQVDFIIWLLVNLAVDILTIDTVNSLVEVLKLGGSGDEMKSAGQLGGRE